MARRNRRTFSRGRKRPRLLWTGQSNTAPGTLAAGAVGATNIVIVAPSDYVAMTTTEQGGTTVVRIVGSLSYRADAAGLSAVYAAILKRGNLEAPPTANTAAMLIEGDVMWFHHQLSDEERTFHVPFDIRVKRKLESDQIVMALEGVATAHTYSMWARALLVGA